MKLNPFVLLLAVAPALSWAASAHAASCVNDVDCTAGGMACGSENLQLALGQDMRRGDRRSGRRQLVRRQLRQR